LKFLFIDETEKFGYFGVSAVLMDSSKYDLISGSVCDLLRHYGWDNSKEFKSTCIFSFSEGDCSINIETRKTIATQIIKNNISSANARFSSFFAFTKGTYNHENYILLLKHIIRALPRPSQRSSDKHLLSIYLDNLNWGDRFIKQVLDQICSIESRGYKLVEYPGLVHSSNKTCGVMLADHIAFISLWNILNQGTTSEDTSEIKKVKNEYIAGLVDEIKNIKIIEVS
jgi:hypothetical protein